MTLYKGARLILISNLKEILEEPDRFAQYLFEVVEVNYETFEVKLKVVR